MKDKTVEVLTTREEMFTEIIHLDLEREVLILEETTQAMKMMTNLSIIETPTQILSLKSTSQS